MNRSVLALVCFALLSFGATSARAAIVFDADNGHYYEDVSYLRTNWESANTLAQVMTFNGMHGYLATIASQAENDFIVANLPDAVAGAEWLGGFQDLTAPDYVEPAGGWRWVTDETWDYTNWGVKQPDNNAGDEQYLLFQPDGTWNDGSPYDYGRGFVVEFSPSAVPEPASLAIWGLGALGCAVVGYRRRKMA